MSHPPNTKALYLEKYFDETYQRAYYYNPATTESLWELPEGAIVADMTKSVMAAAVEPVIVGASLLFW